MSDKEELKEKVIVLRNYSNVLQKKRKIKDDTILRNQKLIYKLQEETKRQQKEIERLNNIINELEKYLIEYFKKEYPDRKLEDYNLENCTYDYALVILGKLQELKGSDKE